jgi:hypothetical protein
MVSHVDPDLLPDPDERPAPPLLRDPPPPPGYTNPLEQSEVLEELFSAAPLA